MDVTEHHCQCVRRRSDSQVGCQTFWADTGLSLPWCQNSSRMLENFKNYNKMVNMARSMLYQDTGCLDPCNYFEYKVLIVLIFLNSFLLKLFAAIAKQRRWTETISPG